MEAYPLITEIITKECERYELISGGFIQDMDILIEQMVANNPQTPKPGCSKSEFKNWKNQLLVQFYSDNSYATYFRKNATKNSFLKSIRGLMSNCASYLKKNASNPSLDKDLRLPGGKTIAYKLSRNLFTEIYPGTFAEGEMFVTPHQVEDRCEERVREIFPLDHKQVVDRLKKNDNEFWGDFIIMFKLIVIHLVNWYDIRIKEYMEEVSSESVISLHKQVDEGKLDNITSGAHLYNSLKKTCFNKLQEYFRKCNKNDKTMDDERWQLMEKRIYTSDPEEFNLQDINEDNENEILEAIAHILHKGDNELYKELIGENKNNFEVLLLHNDQNISYKEIARLYGKNDKFADTLKNRSSRMKKKLIDTMKSMVKKSKGS